jgi:hypothetical protein
MAKKKKISNAEHLRETTRLYNEEGQSSVFDYAEKHDLDWEDCKACESPSPSIKHCCLVCGQETTPTLTDNELAKSYKEIRDILLKFPTESDKSIGKKLSPIVREMVLRVAFKTSIISKLVMVQRNLHQEIVKRYLQEN